ncbi:hypothetical protein D3C80_922010 [compost metagenome]
MHVVFAQSGCQFAGQDLRPDTIWLEHGVSDGEPVAALPQHFHVKALAVQTSVVEMFDQRCECVLLGNIR